MTKLPLCDILKKYSNKNLVPVGFNQLLFSEKYG